MRQTIPARQAVSFEITCGQSVKVINTYGSQVVDTWAFNRADEAEFMSMEHSRVHMGRSTAIAGSILVTNHRRAALSIVEDTSGGTHDTLMAACDRYRYALLGYEGVHDNCTDNLHKALKQLGMSDTVMPCPLNLFQNSAISSDGRLEIAAPVSKPDSFVTLRAEMDLIIVFSACPQDMALTNGPDMTPRDAHYEILSSKVGDS